MLTKNYASREETRRMSHELPIGDAFGGVAYGERNDVVTGYLGYKAAGKAADAQANAANQSTELNREIYQQTRDDYAPYRQAGTQGLNALMRLQGLNGGDPMQYLMMDPSYQFRMDQQQQALDRSAAARGNLLSGRATKDTLKYSGDLASQEYGNVWNRLANIAGVGQSAVGSTANAAQNYGSIAGSNMLQAGNARASGYIGQANAINDAWQRLKETATMGMGAQ